jgi:hypothetical protein
MLIPKGGVFHVASYRIGRIGIPLNQSFIRRCVQLESKEINTEALQLLEALYGAPLNVQQVSKVSSILLPLLSEMDHLNKIDVTGVEPLLPPTWKEGRF